MKLHSISRTAQGVAAIRAVESYRTCTDRLFEDQFAAGFLSPAWRLIVHLMRLPVFGPAILALRERLYPGTVGGLLCRTRYIDDVLLYMLAGHVKQIVILGAGFDSRAYRIPGIDKVHVFEVDHPFTQDYKQKRLKIMLGRLPSNVTYVPIDFERQSLDEAMEASGFRKDVGALFIWEGVTQYITAQAVDMTLQYVSASTLKSSIVFTYIDRGVLTGSPRFENLRRLVEGAARFGEPWVFGLDPNELSEYLFKRGFEIEEHVGAQEYLLRYLKPLDRDMNVFEIEKVVFAR